MQQKPIFSFEIKTPVTSKKNSKQIIFNRKLNRQMIISSSKHKEFERFCSLELLQQKVPRNSIDYPIYVSILLYSKDHRKFDLSNRIESIMDIMVDNDIIADDNYTIVKKYDVTYAGVSKEVSAIVDIYEMPRV